MLCNPIIALTLQVKALDVPIPVGWRRLLRLLQYGQDSGLKGHAPADQGRSNLQLRLADGAVSGTFVSHILKALLHVDRLSVAGVEVLVVLGAVLGLGLAGKQGHALDQRAHRLQLGDIDRQAGCYHLARHVRLVLEVGGAGEAQYGPRADEPVGRGPFNELGLQRDDGLVAFVVPCDHLPKGPTDVVAVATAVNPRRLEGQRAQGGVRRSRPPPRCP